MLPFLFYFGFCYFLGGSNFGIRQCFYQGKKLKYEIGVSPLFHPSVVVINQSSGFYTLFPYEELAKGGAEDSIKHTIDGYLAGNYSGIQINQNQSAINDTSSSFDVFLGIVLLAVIVVAIIIFITWKKIS